MDFVGLLNGFLAPDNGVRRAAEKQINELKVHRDALPLELLKVSLLFRQTGWLLMQNGPIDVATQLQTSKHCRFMPNN